MHTSITRWPQWLGPDGQVVREERIEHERGSLRDFLERCERGSPAAVETIGNWYWIGRGRAPQRHVSRLYERLARRKGHAKAIGAVARHLAEATFWILSKHEPYREP